MEQPKHLKHLKLEDLIANFPSEQYPSGMRPNQKTAFEITAKLQRPLILEMPTGSGKTAYGYTVLKTLRQGGARHLYYTAPTKTIVEQVKELHPEVLVVFGRAEYRCLLFENAVSAEEAPCAMVECPHRVDMETGQTEITGIEPCPYLLAKYRAMQGKEIVACTMAFYILTQLFAKWNDPDGLIIDEAHRIANVARGILSYEITDYYLKRAIELLEDISIRDANILSTFLGKMMKIVKRKSTKAETLLEDHEIKELLSELTKIQPAELRQKVRQSIKEMNLKKAEQRDIIKKLETVTRNLPRYLHSLEYSLETPGRHALDYTFGFYKKELEPGEKVQCRLFIKAYYVAPIIKRILPDFFVAYSATIGDVKTFSFETGIKAPFYALKSDFPADNTRVLIPKDTPNLAVKERSRREPTKVLRTIAKICGTFAKSGIRSLVIIISNKEREKFLWLCGEEKVDAISYGNGHKAKDVALLFKQGKGNVLVGTAANYGEGVDLPKNLAPIIFFLRPGFPSPYDPATLFEEKRFGSMRWRIWNWRVMVEALQVRGRNVRSAKDLGITIFVSQQFRRFIPAVLPEWLEEAYRGNLTLEQCLKETKELLK